MSEDEGLILSRQEVLQLLSEKAREGSVTAAIALERVLRLAWDETGIDAEFERILGEGEGT
jgi:hypothetical protein